MLDSHYFFLLMRLFEMETNLGTFNLLKTKRI